MCQGYHDLYDTAASCALRGKSPLMYIYGKVKPNYPVPVTMDHAAIINFHNPKWSWDWAIEWYKRELRKRLD